MGAGSDDTPRPLPSCLTDALNGNLSHMVRDTTNSVHEMRDAILLFLKLGWTPDEINDTLKQLIADGALNIPDDPKPIGAYLYNNDTPRRTYPTPKRFLRPPDDAPDAEWEAWFALAMHQAQVTGDNGLARMLALLREYRDQGRL